MGLTFSIIIPTYNSSKTLKRCLDSIFSQTFKNVEVWLIDGQSTDKTTEIIYEYSTKYNNIFFISEPDNGIYDAMNKGIKLAKGEWLYFLGSDDELYDDFVFEKVFASISKRKELIVYGNVLIEGNAGWAKNGDIYDGEFDLKKILKKNICHQAIFYNKNVFKKIGNFNINYRTCSDFDFNLRCFSRFKMLHKDILICKFKGGATSFKLEDSNFSSDFYFNLFTYFKFQLYKNAFVENRYSLNKAFEKVRVSNLEKIYCKLEFVVLKLKSRITFLGS